MRRSLSIPLMLLAAAPCYAQWSITGAVTKPMAAQVGNSENDLWLDVLIRNDSKDTLYIQGIEPGWYMIEAFIKHSEDAVWERQNIGVDQELKMLPVKPGREIKARRREAKKDVGRLMMLTFLMAYSEADRRGSRVLLGPFQIPEPGAP